MQYSSPASVPTDKIRRLVREHLPQTSAGAAAALAAKDGSWAQPIVGYVRQWALSQAASALFVRRVDLHEATVEHHQGGLIGVIPLPQIAAVLVLRHEAPVDELIPFRTRILELEKALHRLLAPPAGSSSAPPTNRPNSDWVGPKIETKASEAS